jgi:crossover junction endodeoxyribonuclease RuvC
MSDKGGILALDLSTRTGWAYGLPGAVPVTGVWMLPSYAIDPGRCLAALGNEFADAIWLHQPTQVWVEAPLSLSGQTHANTAMQQFQLDGVVLETCYRWERPVRRAHAGTVRKAVLGRGNNVSKDDVVAWAVARGIAVADHNAADAAMLWAHACLHLAERSVA